MIVSHRARRLVAGALGSAILVGFGGVAAASSNTSSVAAAASTTNTSTTATTQPHIGSGCSSGANGNNSGQIAFSDTVNVDTHTDSNDVGISQDVFVESFGEHNITPAWSPDGSKLAYASDYDGNYEINVVNKDGGGWAQLTTTSTGANTQPTWSPDGTKIAFTSTRDGNSEIYIVDVASKSSTRLTTNAGDDSQPSWDPNDMSKIAFTSTRGTPSVSGIYVINPVTLQLSLLISGGSSADWSPDGTRLVYKSGSAIKFANADGSLCGSFPTPSGYSSVGGGFYDQPHFSPDGTRIVWTDGLYVAAYGMFREVVLTANVDGTNLHAIANAYGYSSGDLSSPDWQPVGAKVLPPPSTHVGVRGLLLKLTDNARQATRRTFQARSNDATIALSMDPTVAGATLKIKAGTTTATYTLPAAGWSAAAPGQFTYRDGRGTLGDVREVVIDSVLHSIFVKAKGASLPSLTPMPSTVAVSLASGTSAYCMSFGPTHVSAFHHFIGLQAPAPSTCTA